MQPSATQLDTSTLSDMSLIPPRVTETLPIITIIPTTKLINNSFIIRTLAEARRDLEVRFAIMPRRDLIRDADVCLWSIDRS